MACEDCRALLGGYVLDALEPDEMDAVRAHVVACADCSREHAALAVLPALLDAAGTTETTAPDPPAALEGAVLDRFARERPPAEPSRWRRWLTRPVPVAAGAAVAAALVTLAVTAALNGSSTKPAHVYSASLRGSSIAPASGCMSTGCSRGPERSTSSGASATTAIASAPVPSASTRSGAPKSTSPPPPGSATTTG